MMLLSNGRAQTMIISFLFIITDFPALCAFSMVGNTNIYDVIIFEYYLKSSNKLDRLAMRLRQRFPRATIIFVLVRHPYQFVHKPTQQSLRNFVDAYDDAEHNWDPHQVIEKILHVTNPEDWEFYEHTDSVDAIRSISKTADGHVFEIDMPKDDIIATMKLFAEELYIWDQVHYTEYTHRLIAGGVEAILQQSDAQRSDEINEWFARDYCDSWFLTGVTYVPHHPELVMRKFRGEKYALEADGMNTYIRLTNRDNRDSDVYVSYMVTSEPDLYPKTRFWLDGGLNRTKQFVIVEPYTTDYNYAVHISDVVKIGTVPSGESDIIVSVLENKTLPFRITGVIVTPPEELLATGLDHGLFVTSLAEKNHTNTEPVTYTIT